MRVRKQNAREYLDSLMGKFDPMDQDVVTLSMAAVNEDAVLVPEHHSVLVIAAVKKIVNNSQLPDQIDVDGIFSLATWINTLK